MDSEHRCVELKTNVAGEKFWELLQDLWTTPGSLKANPQLPYNPPNSYVIPGQHIAFIIASSFLSLDHCIPWPWPISGPISSPHHCPYLSIRCYNLTSRHLRKIRPFQGMIVMLWFLTMFCKCFESYSFDQLIRPPKKHCPPFISSSHHNVFAPLASDQYRSIGLMHPHSFHS